MPDVQYNSLDLTYGGEVVTYLRTDISVTATDGNRYHKFQIKCDVKDYSEGIEFSVLKNPLSDGYRSRSLVGSSAGLRAFSLTLPTLAGTAGKIVEGVNGEQVTREEYLWSLYCECEVTGKPFVLESSRNGQFYLVEFADERLTYQRMLTKLYSTGVNLVQARIDGVSVLQPALVTGLYGYWDADTELDSGDWVGTDGAAARLATVGGDVADVPAVVNGHRIKRFNGTANTGSLSVGLEVDVVYDVILAMKMREGAFSNDCGIFVDIANGLDWIRGDSGTTKFQTDFDTTNFRYFLNVTEYALSNMQAPMNEWGVVHFRNTDGWPIPDGFFVGVDSLGALRAEMDLGDMYFLNKPSMQQCREITEHLINKWR